jgi:hypothetical protein
MADELPDVPALRTIEPPAGGLAALRERIDGARSRARWWWLVAVPAVAALVLVLVLVQRPHGGMLVDERRPETALRDREVGRGDVAFYWVASSPSGRSAVPRRAAVSEVTTISLDDAPRVTTYGAP